MKIQAPNSFFPFADYAVMGRYPASYLIPIPINASRQDLYLHEILLANPNNPSHPNANKKFDEFREHISELSDQVALLGNVHCKEHSSIPIFFASDTLDIAIGSFNGQYLMPGFGTYSRMDDNEYRNRVNLERQLIKYPKDPTIGVKPLLDEVISNASGSSKYGMSFSNYIASSAFGRSIGEILDSMFLNIRLEKIYED